MSANVDDYYSNISSDSSDDSKTTKKKPIIKKKIIVKAKKVVKTVESKPEVVQETAHTALEDSNVKINTSTQPKVSRDKSSQSLNDAISAGRSKKPGFTVVRRADARNSHPQSTESSSTSKSSPAYKIRGSDTQNTNSSSGAPKFKPGFTKNAPKPGQSFNSNDDR